DPRPVLVQALRFLGQRDVVAWQEMSVEELLRFAVAHWRLTAVTWLAFQEVADSYLIATYLPPHK
ncbi:hypothetical protein MJN76_32415, partial [Salmonella enterica subsp. enterica serovar Anatum]|nr:hypothetical protein [Salmonella enterica subsp. enterica serovar Anatum]